MTNSFIGLILTLIVGLSFFVGYYLTKIFKNNNKLISITMGIAATVMTGMMFFDLIPEVFEIFSSFKLKYLIIFIFVLIGFLFLFILDKLIPHHDDHNDSNDHKHLYHIGVITCISLILHNFVEGSAIYSVALSNLKASVLMMVGVLLHNIPLGMITVSQILDSKKNNKYLILVLLVLSSLFGGLTIFAIQSSISEFVLGVLISITLGMSIYIVFFELVKEIFENESKKDSLIGIIIGVILISISLLI